MKEDVRVVRLFPKDNGIGGIRLKADILIVSWNARFFLERFLPLVMEFSPSPHRVILWDNGSKDGSVRVLKSFERAYPDRFLLFQSRKNLGHGPAMEKLLDRADGDCIISLDCDATPLRADWIEKLTTPLAAGAVASGAFKHRAKPRYPGGGQNATSILAVSAPLSARSGHLTFEFRQSGLIGMCSSIFQSGLTKGAFPFMRSPGTAHLSPDHG